MGIQLVGTYEKQTGLTRKSLFAVLEDDQTGERRQFEAALLPLDTTPADLQGQYTLAQLWQAGQPVADQQFELMRLRAAAETAQDQIAADLATLPTADTALTRQILGRLLVRQQRLIQVLRVLVER